MKKILPLATAPHAKSFAAASIFAALLSVTQTASAQIIAYDNAAQTAYDDGWQNFDNGGFGWNVWVLSSNAQLNSNASIASSTTLGASGGGNIDTSGRSFRLSDTTASGSYIDVFRYVPGDLLSGQTFSFDMQVNFRAGFKGINIRDTNDSTSIFKFEAGNPGTGDDYIVYNVTTGGGSIGNTYSSDTRFSISLTQTSLSGGTWTIARTGGVTSTSNGTFTGQVSSFQLFTVGAGSANQQAIFYNNFQIVPEPSTAALAIAGVVGALLLRRRRNLR